MSEPVRTCRHRLDQGGEGGTDWSDVSSGHGRAGTRRLGRNAGFEGSTRVRCSNPFGDQACPPVSLQVASKAATGAPAWAVAGRASNSASIGVPPRCPPGWHRGTVAVSVQLMQRIDR
jgi:hypothetical protein